jgi:PAP2 superfamily
MTVAMNSPADGMINGVATAQVMVIGGQASPDATVHMTVGNRSLTTQAGPKGNYQFRLSMPSGTYDVDVQARSLSGGLSTASMSMTHGDAIIAWVNAMDAVIEADKSNVGLASRTMAMVGAAMYDAVNDIERTGSVFKVDVKAPRWAMPSASASAAAYSVLSALDPAMQPMLAATMAQSLAAVPAGVARNVGVEVGLAVAQGILDWRAGDGSMAVVPYVPGTAPGQWRPTAPNFGVAWGPEWGQIKPFAVSSAAAYLPPPPPALNSAQYAADLNQVESLGAANSTTRTADQTQIGIFWSYDNSNSGSPAVRFEEVAASVALQQHNSLTQNARMFGLVSLALGDAGMVAWDAKYTYNVWRPITAIRLANTDGNPATVADPTWTPLGAPGNPGQANFTPAFPGYVSGHATFGSALFTVLADFYGTDKIHFTLTSDEMPGVTRSYTSFSQASYENAISRIYLGIHFWSDETAGITAGAAVGNDIYATVMTPSRKSR